jgi:hypothetical protein
VLQGCPDEVGNKGYFLCLRISESISQEYEYLNYELYYGLKFVYKYLSSYGLQLPKSIKCISNTSTAQYVFMMTCLISQAQGFYIYLWIKTESTLLLLSIVLISHVFFGPPNHIWLHHGLVIFRAFKLGNSMLSQNPLQ